MVKRTQEWLALHDRLRRSLDDTTAQALMDFLPPTEWPELATRADMQALTARLHGDMAELRAELHGEMSELRADLKGDMSELRAELRGEMADLRSELKGDMAELRAELKGDMAELRSGVQRDMSELRSDLLKWTVGTVVAGMAMSAGISTTLASIIAG